LSELLRFRLPDGQSVVVEASPSASTGPATRAGRIRDVTHDLVEEIRGVSATISSTLSEIQSDARPDVLRLTLGLTFTAEAGVVVAKTSTAGNIVVEMTWNSPPGGRADV
jgi:hypothetical protein